MSADASTSASGSSNQLPQVQDLNLTADAQIGSEQSMTAQEFLQISDGDDDDVQEYDGDLPDFSDEETASNTVSVSAVPNRLPPKPKGPPGRKRAPLSSLKKKMTPSGPSTATATSSSKDKRVQQVSAAPGGVKLTDSQLDAAIAQLVDEHPDMAGQFTRDQVQAMIHQAGISKRFLQGKEGLGGKNQKDMA